MTRNLLLLLAVLSLSACGNGTGPDLHRETSPNGIDYLRITLPEEDTVSIRLAWDTDWAWRDDVNQMAPYIGVELIFAAGAQGYRAGEAGELFNDAGADGVLVANPDQVLGFLEVRRENLDEIITIANAHLRAPELGEVWFDRVRGAIAQNLVEINAQPGAMAFNVLRRAVFDTHPLHVALSLDEPAMFDALTAADVVAWHEETILAMPQTIVIAGPVNADEAGRAIDALLAGLDGPARMLARDVVPDFTPRRILLHLPGLQEPLLAFLAPVPPTRDGQEFEDLLINLALGQGAGSVLFDAVRTQLRASYGFESGIETYTRALRFVYMAGTLEPGRLAEAERIVRTAYDAFQAKGPDGGDIADWKAEFSHNLERSLASSPAIAVTALENELDGFPLMRILSLPDELDDVTVETVAGRLARAWPDSADFLMVAVSGDAEALAGACVITGLEQVRNCPPSGGR